MLVLSVPGLHFGGRGGTKSKLTAWNYFWAMHFWKKWGCLCRFLSAFLGWLFCWKGGFKVLWAPGITLQLIFSLFRVAASKQRGFLKLSSVTFLQKTQREEAIWAFSERKKTKARKKLSHIFSTAFIQFFPSKIMAKSEVNHEVVC